jgi:predicted nucleotidyltransferase
LNIFALEYIVPMPVKHFNIEKFAKSLEETFPEILFAFLFGSARKGKIHAGSDIDLAIYIKETDEKAKLISHVLEFMEFSLPPADYDLAILNTAEPLLCFEALTGTLLFIREDAIDIYAGFYSLTCRLYEDQINRMKKQLEYRGYEVQWDH